MAFLKEMQEQSTYAISPSLAKRYLLPIAFEIKCLFEDTVQIN